MKSSKDRLSSFGERLQSLSETFYSTILEESKENKFQIKNAKDLEDHQCEDFTFDQCSTNQSSTSDNFSFTFHSIDQTKSGKSEKVSQEKKIKRVNQCSTPNSKKKKENFLKQCEDETIIVEDNRRRNEPVIIGYYPVDTYQPVCFPPSPIYLTKEQIQK